MKTQKSRRSGDLSDKKTDYTIDMPHQIDV
jgi:hypothetical protein